MKVIVFCIDSLEMELVKRWHLIEYLQSYNGVHDIRVAIWPDDPLYAPLLWTSFLLGKPAYKYGFTHKEIVYRRRLIAYRKLGFLYPLRLKFLKGRNLHLRKLLTRLGFYDKKEVVRKSHEIERLPREALKDTLPEIAKQRGFRVWIEEFPSYNDVRHAEWRAKADEYVSLSLQKKT